MSIYETKFTIEYKTLAPDLTVRFPALMEYIQEASIRHTESTAHKMQWYADNQRGWILTTWHIRIHSLPKWNDDITVRTWPSRFKGILADRSFAAIGANGETLVSAVAAWVFMDIDAKRPVRPPQEVIDGYGEVLAPVHEGNAKMPDMAGFETVSTRELIVARHDIDTNHHVNNVRYIEWAFDGVPADLYENRKPAEIKVAYRRECREGERLLLDCNRRGDEVATIIRKADEPETVVTEIYTRWE